MWPPPDVLPAHHAVVATGDLPGWRRIDTMASWLVGAVPGQPDALSPTLIAAWRPDADEYTVGAV